MARCRWMEEIEASMYRVMMSDFALDFGVDSMYWGDVAQRMV